MRRWGNKRYHSLDYHYREIFGEKVYKLSLNAGMTCPNRDGKISKGGCIFCSEGGSGENAGSVKESIKSQLRSQKEFIKNKYKGKKYIAYFQAFTNTYAPIDYLRMIFFEAVSDEDVVGISIATRPDCLDDDIIALLKELSDITYVWIELGLQTINDKTAELINRGYKLDIFNEAVKKLSYINVKIVVHIILGLPYENIEDMKANIFFLNQSNISGIKLHLLHVLKNTKLEKLYFEKKFNIMEEKDYCDLLIWIIEHLREDIVIHRLTGDGPKDLLIAPIWSLKKINVLNYVNHRLKVLDTFQGSKIGEKI